MLRDDRPVEIGLFDNVNQPTRIGNITVFPRDWIFRVSGKPLASCQFHSKNILISLQMRFGYYSRLNNLISSSCPKYRPLQDFFKRTEFVLVGHDGVFCIESCGIIHLAKKAGKRIGILGSGRGLPKSARLYQKWIYRRSIKESDFCIFREHYSYENMKQLSPDPDKPILAPDPAFAMRPAEAEAARKVLENHEPYWHAREAAKCIVAVTVREKGIVYDRAFSNVQPSDKRRVHAEFIAKVLDYLIHERNVFILFLPHAIEKDSSDVNAARHVTKAMTSDAQSYMILDENLEARLLKSIIRECDFLIGERAHSIISSISVATAFLALTNTSDHRTHGIVGKMCGCEEQIIDLDEPNVEQTREKVLKAFDNRATIRESLEHTSKVLSNELKEISRIVKMTKQQT